MEAWLNLFRRTRREYFADFFITPPLTLGLLLISLAQSDLWWPVLFATGLLLWTFYEYVTHRWVAHGIRFFREAHALHHKAQRDYIALHPLATLSLYAIFWALFGFGGGAMSTGFSAGYVFYSVVHTAFHYGAIEPGQGLYRLKLRHALHHRADCNYGVSTSLWDRVFGTEAEIRLV